MSVLDLKQEEQQLISRISRGDASAFEKLFDQYWEFLHNVAYNRLESADVADDLVQDVFADLWNNRQSLEIHTSVRSYLYQAIKHKVYNHIRHKSVRNKEKYIRRIHDEYYMTSSSLNTEETVQCNELSGLLDEEVEQLSGKTRTIFQLSRKHHYTHQEIAEELDCSKKTVEYHIGKVLSILRMNLGKYVTVLMPFLLIVYCSIRPINKLLF